MVGLEPNDKAATRPCILIVEDDLLTRIAAAEFLRDSGFAVIEAASAAEARVVVSSSAAVDLVFTDIQMPGDMDGRSLAGWLAREMPKLPVILTSARLEGDTQSRGQRRFVRKPYRLSDIENQIRELLGYS
jgi:CheY-like chemotaxis protein